MLFERCLLRKRMNKFRRCSGSLNCNAVQQFFEKIIMGNIELYNLLVHKNHAPLCGCVLVKVEILHILEFPNFYYARLELFRNVHAHYLKTKLRSFN